MKEVEDKTVSKILRIMSSKFTKIRNMSELIDVEQLKMRGNIPCEFLRKPRSWIVEGNDWKATNIDWWADILE